MLKLNYDCISFLWLNVTTTKTIETYFLVVLEARSLKLVSLTKTRCQQGHTPCIVFRGASVPCLFQVLVALGIPWLVAILLQSFLPWPCLCLGQISLFLLRALVIHLGPTQIMQNNLLKILTLLTITYSRD